MIAATSVNGDLHSQDGLDRASGIEDPVEEPARTVETRSHQMRRHSGLSALIQAATVQLGQLAEVASSQLEERVEDIPKNNVDEPKEANPNEVSPDIVPKPDPTRQSFPELLMTLAVDPANIDVITFLPDGKFFAIRAKQFSEEVMIHYFAVTTFEEFLELSDDWGFNRILQDNNCTGIEVFRHPLFVRGNWEKCTHIKFGESPTHARVSALPEGAKIEYCLQEDSQCKAPGGAAAPLGSPSSSKRRLSPGFLARRASESSVSSKHRVVIKEPELPSLNAPIKIDRSRSDSDGGNESLPAASYSQQSQSDELRSVALAITTEKMKLKNEKSDSVKQSTPLVEEAVESCTHTIVTDAIETLLRDESHTKETYLKHKEELGRSSLPGVVPITKQLFSPEEGKTEDAEGTPVKTMSPPSEVVTKRPSVSPPTLDEAKAEGSNPADGTSSQEPSPTLKPTTVESSKS